MTEDQPSYVLGHDHAELTRLSRQAELVDSITHRFLRQAGVGPGMRVLDVGSGAGHVSFLAASLVGEGGEVVGVDQSPAAVEASTELARTRGLSQVTFVAGDPGDLEFDRPFDAVVGRYVLQFQAEPASLLRRVVGKVRSGGAVMFHELDWGGVRSFPTVPTYDACWERVMQTLRLSGTETAMGMKLYSTFIDAGLSDPWLRTEALAGGGAHARDVLEQLVTLAGTLAETMEQSGVLSRSELGIDSLLARMTAETEHAGAVVVGRFQVGCGARV